MKKYYWDSWRLCAVLRVNNPSATWRLAYFLCAEVQAPGGALAWALPGIAQD
jgi:hypothetical protein